MEHQPPEGEFSSLSELTELRGVFKKACSELAGLIGTCDDPTSLPKMVEVNSSYKSFIDLYSRLRNLEADLEKRGMHITANGGGILDCDAARDEILGRIARIRERGGDKGPAGRA